MGFPPQIKEDALVASGRHCCICHKFCGTKVEVHHIVPRGDGGEDSFENAVPLCFDCHADMRSYDHNHPKGCKYTIKELKRHRDNWYQKVAGNVGTANREEVVETDKKVYRTLLRFLPWNGTIQFLRDNNFAGASFERSETKDLSKYWEQCQNPLFEFIDPDLEGLRADLTEKIRVMKNAIALETFPAHLNGCNSVPAEWEFEQPERFRRAVEALHRGADDVCEAYDSLVRTATRKLGILPEA
ncbi:MAG: HNH endonuclease [Desulfofustis sp.]|nr:HNH endonuclease [Desulfofustis sp.]